MAMACATLHAPMAAAITAAAASASITCYSYEDDGTGSWSLSSGTSSSSSSSPRRQPYRRLLHDEAQRLRRERRSQGSGAHTPRWVRRTPDQMARYVEDDRAGHTYGRHVLAAVRAVRATASRASADMRQAMASFVAKLTFREMCFVLGQQRGWRQARDFFAWMKLQLCYEPSVVAYTILLRLYGQIGKIGLAEETFLEMLQAGCEPDAVACGTLLCAYARWGRHNDMLLFYAAVRRRDIVPSISAFNFMVSSLHKQKLHGNVIHLWKQMLEASAVPDHFTYTLVISSYVKEGLLQEAMDAFGEMKRRRFAPDEATYSLLISSSAKNGRGEQALRLHQEMRVKGIVPSNYTCASLLTLHCKNEDYSKALSLFSEMEQDKIVPDEVIYGILVRIYGKLGLYEDAQLTFEQIDKAGLLSDEQTYVAMAQVHMNAQNYDRALQVLDSMRLRDVKPSHFSHSALLRCHVAKEDEASAEDAFRALSKYGQPDVFCCNDLLRLYMKLGHLHKAREIILKMSREDLQLDEDLCVTVMEFSTDHGIEIFVGQTWGLVIASQLITKFAREGSTDEAKFLYEHLTKLGAKPDDSAIATLIVQYGQAQQLEQAQELFETASTLFPVGGYVFNAMVDALCKCGKTGEAYHRFMELIDQGHSGDAVTISILVTHLTKHGKFQEAENIIFRCLLHDEAELDTVVYNTFIKSMLDSGKLYSAVSIYDRMISSGIPWSIQTFNIMISVYGQGGKLDKAVEMFDAAQELGLTIDEKTYINMLSFYGKAGKHHEASLLFSRMKEDGIRPGKISFNSMINAYATSGLHNEADIIFQEMQKTTHVPDSHTYLALIRTYTAGRCYSKAEEAIQMMLHRNITPSCTHFNHLISAFLKEGQIDEAQRIYNQMKEIGVAADLACCRTMMRLYLEYGCIHDGILFFETACRLLKPDSFILSAAFHLYEHSGRESEAGDVLDAISTHGASFLRSLEMKTSLHLSRSKEQGAKLQQDAAQTAHETLCSSFKL
ncbi:hypothetical protein GUJ93_ZPchr0012g20826 [Zizania palustris]|uniref:PROP1-like PPR domain-containing protein n=1 Tax=Zizania palustris TaxID=103762 RepID=A0A8J5WS54_ZIZPA|nr:hypothetical protein GUJ93_ZPchr0012g20826 [Zizania palustris]